LSHMMRPMRCAATIAVCLAGLGCSSQPTRTSTETETTAPRPAPSKSRLETASFSSAALGVDKDHVIYFPAGYDSAPDRRWPVLYYLHGLTGDETNWSVPGGMAADADALGLQAIVVMPDGDDGFYADAATDYDYAKCLA